MDQKEHLTIEGLKKIVAIKASLNLGLSDQLKEAFPDIPPAHRPLVVDPEIKDPNWISGFASAEGCFFIDILQNKTTKLGKTARVGFKLTQHYRDEQLMKSIMKYFGVGNVYRVRDISDLVVANIDALNENIIPFFDEYKIVGSKFNDYSYFKKVAGLIKNKAHLTYDGIEQIYKIKSGVNKGRQ